MKFAVFVCLILCGCARPLPPVTPITGSLMGAPPLPPKPKPLLFSAPAGSVTPKAMGTPVYVGSFIYPADMTNYLWALEKTTNGSTWSIIIDGMVGPASGDYTYTNTLHESPLWFRMRGHH